jgi:hypothetical protein
VCVGALEASTIYKTKSSDLPLTYQVPEPGWSNDEDLPGDFLLVPPRSDLSGVNAGTSDFIRVYPEDHPVGVLRFADVCNLAGSEGPDYPGRDGGVDGEPARIGSDGSDTRHPVGPFWVRD